MKPTVNKQIDLLCMNLLQRGPLYRWYVGIMKIKTRGSGDPYEHWGIVFNDWVN
jgi:hypothetical protein